MNILITGVAGFIGSSLAVRLLNEGYKVRGIDCFLDNYASSIKRDNVSKLLGYPSFDFHEGDLLTTSLVPLLSGIDACYHQAALPGVRSSWGSNFDEYVRNNIQVTQRLLEFLKDNPLRKFVFASTSSVYGDCPLPMTEDQRLRPVSPYGVTKLAVENLLYLYRKNYGFEYTTFRYFTVYGPKQRPDMAFHKFIKSLILGEEIVIYGDGTQSRDFTYIDDVLDANIRALHIPDQGETFNLGGGSRVSLLETVGLLEEILNVKAKIRFEETQKGDVMHTFADTQKARQALGYKPLYNLEKGLSSEAIWVSKVLEEVKE